MAGDWHGFGCLLTSVVSSEELKFIFAVGVAIYSIFFLFPRCSKMLALIICPRALSSDPGRSHWQHLGASRYRWGHPHCYYDDSVRAINCGVGRNRCGRSLHHRYGCHRLHDHRDIANSIGSASRHGGFGLNIPALLAISAVSVITAPAGAKLAHRLDTDRLKQCFGFYLIAVATIILRQTL